MIVPAWLVTSSSLVRLSARLVVEKHVGDGERFVSDGKVKLVRRSVLARQFKECVRHNTGRGLSPDSAQLC